jgi:branched-chain amino acid transport system permease protein
MAEGAQVLKESELRAAPVPEQEPTPGAVVRPPVFRRHPFVQLVLFIAVAIVGSKLFAHNPASTHYINQWLMYAIAGVGFYLMFVVAGRFAFCQTFMMSTGGYIAAHFSQHHGFFVSIGLATLLVAVIGAAFAIICARTASFLFAVATLALVQIGATVYVQWTDFTGPNGLVGNVPIPVIFGQRLAVESQLFWMFLAGLIICLLIALLIERSAVGREAAATRTMPDVARSLGIPTRSLQIALFVVGSGMGGLAGGMTAYWQGSISTDTFSLDLALGLFLIPIMGGVASVWGTVLGSLIYVELANVLSGLDKYASLAYGVILVVVIVVLPQGLLGGAHQIARLIWPQRSRSAPPRTARSLLPGGPGRAAR